MIGVKLTLRNDKELVRALLALPEAIFKRVIVSAVTKAARPVVNAARERVSVETGALKRSIGVIIKKYPRKGIVTAVIGARGGIYVGGKAQKSAASGDGHRNPALYSHLVEKGHRIVRARSLKQYRNRYGALRTKRGSGHTIGRVAGRPFLQPSLVSRTSHVVGDMRSAIGKGIEREARRQAKRASL